MMCQIVAVCVREYGFNLFFLRQKYICSQSEEDQFNSLTTAAAGAGKLLARTMIPFSTGGGTRKRGPVMTRLTAFTYCDYYATSLPIKKRQVVEKKQRHEKQPLPIFNWSMITVE